MKLSAHVLPRAAMKLRQGILASLIAVFPLAASAGPNYMSGSITSLKASATDPAIRIGSNLVPDQCNGGTYGWLYILGTAEERNTLYASALAFALSNIAVTVYTNTDGGTCRITSIQATSL